MPKIQLPTDSSVGYSATISQSGINSANFAAADMGSSVISSGASIANAGLSQAQQGLQTLKRIGDEQAKLQESVRLAEYSNKLNEAKLSFSKRIDERVSQQYDKDGNPTFDKLTDDVGSLGNSVRDEILKSIQDPQVRDRFVQTFNSDIVNKQISSLSVARGQKQQYVKNSISSGIDSLIQQAGSDNSANTKFYINEIDKLTKQAEMSGALNYDSAQNLRDQARGQIVDAQYTNLINSDPQQALQILSSSTSSELGVSDKLHQNLLEKAQAAHESQVSRDLLQKINDDYAISEQQNISESQIKLGIQDGSMDTKDIVNARQKGVITEDQYNSLQKYNANKTQDKFFKSKTNLGISTAVASGKPASDFTSSQVGDHYKQRVAMLTPEGQSLSLAQKASVAEQYKVPVKPLQHEMEFDLLRNDGNGDVATTVQVFDQLVKESPETLQGMDSDAMALAAITSNYMEHTSLSPQDALGRAKAQLTSLDTPEGQQNLKSFRKEDAFNEDIDSTIQDMYDGWLGKTIDPEARASLKELYKDAYIKTGDTKSSIKLVKAQTAALFGQSEFNEEKGFFNDKETLMFLPPEKMFPGFNAGQLKDNLKMSLDSIQLPEGISQDNVQIQSDSLTRLSGQPISYGLYYRNQYGEKMPVTDENGIAQRWAPDPEKEQQQKRQQQVQDLSAQAQQEAALTQQIIPKDLLEANGNKLDLHKDLAKVVAAAGDKSTSFYKLASSFGSFQDRNSKRAIADFFKNSMDNQINEDKASATTAAANMVLNSTDVKTVENLGTVTDKPKNGDIAILEDKAGIVAEVVKDKVKVLQRINNALKIGTHSIESIMSFRKTPKSSDIKARLNTDGNN